MLPSPWFILNTATLSLSRSGFVTHNQTETRIRVTLKVQHEQKWDYKAPGHKHSEKEFVLKQTRSSALESK